MGAMAQTYQAYLLRFWRESEADPWRATLEDPHTGERLAFGGAERLLAYLARHLAVEEPILPNPPPTRDQP